MGLLVELARKLDPAQYLIGAGITPDPWQAEVIRARHKALLLNCSRQAGKSTIVAGMALDAADMLPEQPVIILAPTQKQSGELLRAVMSLHGDDGLPIEEDSSMRVEFRNGARIIALPGKDPKNIRGFSKVSLLVVDEAAWVSDALYRAVRPMLAVSGGRIVLLSTPFGKRGFFHDEWANGENWQRVMITADQCPRITPQFLAEEKRKLPEANYMQEYFCQFNEMEGAAFSQTDILRAISDEVEPLFFTPTSSDLVTVPMEPLFQ